MLKAQCEIMKHALPQTFVDTMVLKETMTITTAYSVTIPKVIQCMTFETRTNTAVSIVTQTMTVNGLIKPEIPVNCFVKPECVQCSYDFIRPTELLQKPSGIVDVCPTSIVIC